VADDIAATPLQDIDLRVGAERAEASARESDFAIIEELRDLMSANVGVIRDAAGLSGALKAIRRLSSRARDIEVSNMLTTALMISASSLARRESRGAQFRADYPQPDPAFARRSQMTLAEALRVADEVGA
jgi:L-aspartate oxidase